jgi:Glyoxalase-like domain
VTALPTVLDHLVYATPSLDRTLEEVQAMFGVAPLRGGTHPAWGTQNAILPLSPNCYLEIIGPDPARRPGGAVTIFGLTSLPGPRLVTWAAKGAHLASLVARALTQGIRLGLPIPGSRLREDGSRLSWELTDPLEVTEGGLVPFFIDWGDSPHPAAAPASVALIDFRARHPEPSVLRAKLQALNLDLTVEPGPRPALVATFRTPAGQVTLR